MQAIDPAAIFADTLDSEQRAFMHTMSKAALIELYNREAKRLSPVPGRCYHVDYTCKKGYIIGLFALLPRRYQMMMDDLSNEQAATKPLIAHEESAPSEASERMEKAPLTKGNQGFQLLR